jgi:hypothetical protein
VARDHREVDRAASGDLADRAVATALHEAAEDTYPRRVAEGPEEPRIEQVVDRPPARRRLPRAQEPSLALLHHGANVADLARTGNRPRPIPKNRRPRPRAAGRYPSASRLPPLFPRNSPCRERLSSPPSPFPCS